MLIKRQFSKFLKFNYKDSLNISSLLTSQEKMIQESANTFCQEYLAPKILESNRKEIFDKEIYLMMGEAGFFGSTLSNYNCPGISNVAYGLINKELERVDSAYRSVISVQSSLVITAINEFGSSKIKDKYLPELISGKLIGAFGLTEPDHGSDPGSMKTRLRKVNGKYILSGSKTWITSSPIADIFVIWAKNDEGDIVGVISERKKQIETPKIQGKLSLRASETGMILIDDLEIDEDNILNVKGLKGPFTCLNKARLGISYGVLGAAEDCFYTALEYCKNRKQFDATLADFQLPQKKFAEMATDIALGELGVLQVCRQIDNNEAAVEMISLVKRNNTLIALDIAREARDMMGGNGIVDEYKVMRHLMNLETTKTYEGTADIHALILGRAITGSQSFSRKL